MKADIKALIICHCSWCNTKFDFNEDLLQRNKLLHYCYSGLSLYFIHLIIYNYV